jgi:electron transport complex protein RnfE
VILGAGTFFNIKIFGDWFTPITIFILAPGAFFVLACLTALQNKLKMPCATNGSAKGKKAKKACCGDCASCAEAKEETEE